MKNKTKTPDVQGLLAKIVDIKTKLGNPKLPAGVRNFLTLALVVVVAAFTKSCKDDPAPPQPKQLTGTVNISGKMGVGDQLTASIDGSNAQGKGTFNYQWRQINSDTGAVVLVITGANGEEYTITEDDVGHKLGVVVGNNNTTDFKGTIKGVSAGGAFPRTFDLTFLSKTVVLQDATGGTTELALATRTKVQDALTPAAVGPDLTAKFNAILATGNFAIVINTGADYPNDYAVDGYKILFRESQLLGYALSDIRDIVLHEIEAEMPCAPNCQCPELHSMAPSQSNVRMAKAVPQYNRAMQLRDNRIASRQT